jgi:hypothetical protein
VASASNYGERVDRRMPELVTLAAHPHPYDLMYACNFALHRTCLGDLRFDATFDGYWGYEDIELGYRLARAGRRFRYAPEAYVFHQEHVGDTTARAAGRLRNFALADRLIPGFAEYRRCSARAGAFPDGVLPDSGRVPA